MLDQRLGLRRKSWRVGKSKALGLVYRLTCAGSCMEEAHQLSALSLSSVTCCWVTNTQLPNRCETPERSDRSGAWCLS